MMARKITKHLAPLIFIVFLLTGCDHSLENRKSETPPTPPPTILTEAKEQPKLNNTSPIVLAARRQVGLTKSYDPSYVGLDYPGGDVPIETGVCTDVIVRALREALQIDLQKEVHESMKAAFSDYPNNWNLTKPDRNIDHRRVPNLQKYFKRKGYSIAITQRAKDYQPGDIVTCTVGKRMGHIMIVSNKKNQDGVPYIIHNIGGGAQEEDRLFEFRITGHYRIK